MIWNNPLVVLQNQISNMYSMLPADGTGDHEEYREYDIAKRVTFASFVTTPREDQGDSHYEEMLYMVRRAFPLNARLMWRLRPAFVTDTKVVEGKTKVSYFLRMRIGEVV